ncbi:hypothetical protein MYBA111488_20515 [Mycobacterium basiliense]
MHRSEHGNQPQDTQGARDAEPAHHHRKAGRDGAAEHQEQHHGHQRQGQHFHPSLVGGDGAGQRFGHRLKASELNRAAVELLQGRRDVLVVVQDGVVVVALKRNRHKGVLLVLRRHPLDDRAGAVGCSQVAGPSQDLVGVVGHELVELVGDLFRPSRVVDSLAVGGLEDGHDMAGSVAPVDLVTQHRGFHRLAAVVVKPALCDVVTQAQPENAAAEAQSHRDADYDEPVAVHSSTPPGEHVSSLLDRYRPAHCIALLFDCQTLGLLRREVCSYTRGQQRGQRPERLQPSPLLR